MYQYYRENTSEQSSIWSELGIELCYLKHISFAQDRPYITKKRHYHTHIEMHLIVRGAQIYEVEGHRLTVGEGHCLQIAPHTYHTVAAAAADIEKYALCVRLREGGRLASALQHLPAFALRPIDSALFECLQGVSKERHTRAPFSGTIVRDRVAECILRLLRDHARGAEAQDEPAESEDGRIAIVKRYIHDNVRLNPSLRELAALCRVSEKHLTRIFRRAEQCTVAEYVRARRCLEIERLLCNTSRPLREISDEMHFSSEYYFNAFYKKHSGMTPGAYRRSLRNA